MAPQSETSAPALGGSSRTAALSYISRPDVMLDVLVVGGGITGAGIALDATTRGLNTAIVEAGDWGSGTSSRSSKLIHGGIRYLEQLNFPLVAEALAERNRLLQCIAPHLVHPVRFLYPFRRAFSERAYVGAGMLLYDALARVHGGAAGLPRHRHLTRRQLYKSAPGLRGGAFRGGLSYSDAQVDDARLVLTVVRTAVAYGAHATSRVRVLSYLKNDDRVVGVIARDELSGQLSEIRASQVMSATGVWTNENTKLLDAPIDLEVRASQGVHLVVPRKTIRSTQGLLLRTAQSVLFVIPWGEYWVIGTTDTPWHGDVAHPSPEPSDITYLLDEVNTVLNRPIRHSDIVSVFAGLRPLVNDGNALSSRVSREHKISHPSPGLTLIAGGKLTTYRVMAADAVHAAHAHAGAPTLPDSVTQDLPLVGAVGLRAVQNAQPALAREYGLTLAQIARLLKRYGTLLTEVLDPIHADASLRDPLPYAPQTIAAEVRYAVTHEGALTVHDVLERRTRIALETPDRGSAAAEGVAKLVGAVLGWDTHRMLQEAAEYRQSITAERNTQLWAEEGH